MNNTITEHESLEFNCKHSPKIKRIVTYLSKKSDPRSGEEGSPLQHLEGIFSVIRKIYKNKKNED